MVVTAGETDLELRLVTMPRLLSKDRAVALAVVQDRVLDCPAVKDEGLAVKEEMTGAGGGGRFNVVKVISPEEAGLLLPSMEVTLKW